MTALITSAAVIIAGMGWAIVVLWKQRIAARDDAADERANAAWWRALANSQPARVEALRAIIEAGDTRYPNATVQRMTRIAKKALDV